MENIFLGFSSESNSKATNEAVIKQMLEQYNSKAEKIGLKNYLLTTTAHHSVHACDALGGRECFTTLIHREVGSVTSRLVYCTLHAWYGSLHTGNLGKRL